MIVRETEHAFFMTTQHEHAQLSGRISAFMQERLFGESYRSEVHLAIQEHDRGWIRLDEVPIWNDRKHAPYSMIDYPLLPKLILYRVGLDETEQRSEYAALLCSMHYCSFHAIKTSSAEDCMQFMNHERIRQERIREKLQHPDEKIIQQHLALLQLCDDLSLYVCMNVPGVDKANEHPWFKDGFEQTIDEQSIDARWIDPERIRLTPHLFKEGFTTFLMLKEVPKEAIHKEGIHMAYQEAELKEQKISFVR